MVILCIIRTCTPNVSFCLLFRLILNSGYKVGWSLLGLTSVLRFPDIWVRFSYTYYTFFVVNCYIIYDKYFHYFPGSDLVMCGPNAKGGAQKNPLSLTTTTGDNLNT